MLNVEDLAHLHNVAVVNKAGLSGFMKMPCPCTLCTLISSVVFGCTQEEYLSLLVEYKEAHGEPLLKP